MSALVKSPFRGIDTRSDPLQTQGVSGHRGEPVASAASVLQPEEVEDIVTLARQLPLGWVVQITPPHGQLVMLPRAYAHAFHRCVVADRELSLVYRGDGVHGIRTVE